MFNMGSLQLAPDPSGRETLLRALVSFAEEDFSVRLPAKLKGIDDEITAAFNAAAEVSERRAGQGRRLAERTRQVKREIKEITRTKSELMQRSEQMAHNARCMQEYLADVSSEQQSLLNSMLILAKLLADNPGNNLSPKQIDYAQTIYAAGTQLQSLIEDIFNLTKMERATVRKNDGRGPNLIDRRVQAGMLDGKMEVSNGEFGNVVQPMYDTKAQAYRGPRSRRPDDGIVLIAECDPHVATAMLELVRNNGYQGEVATSLRKLRSLIKKNRPDAIILGANLSDSDGWTALDQVRHDPQTRHLPISMGHLSGHIHACLQSSVFCGSTHGVTAAENDEFPGPLLSELGVVAGRDIRQLLLVDATESRRLASADSWRHAGIEVIVAASGAQGLAALRKGNCDAMVVNTELPDMSSVDLMKQIMAMDLSTDLPVAIIGTANGALEIGVCRRRRALDDVLTETTLFLRKVMGTRPPVGQELPPGGRSGILELVGRKALIVDDNILDIYALTGVLEQQGMVVRHAENGAEGIEVLRAHADIDVVLMNVDMTALDSRELVGAIRNMASSSTLPIIAVTAGAAHGGRERCIEIGASDYIEKPVNVEQLLSLLRVWLVGLR